MGLLSGCVMVRKRERKIHFIAGWSLGFEVHEGKGPRLHPGAFSIFSVKGKGNRTILFLGKRDFTSKMTSFIAKIDQGTRSKISSVIIKTFEVDSWK